MRKLTIVVLAFIASVGVAAMADAAKPKKDLKTKVSIRADRVGGGGDYGQYSEGFTGKVQAKGRGPARVRKQCKAGRRVTIFRRGGGRVGADVTNRQGRYAVPVRGDYAEGGRYYAKAKRKNLRGRQDCKGGRSGTIRVIGA